MAGKGDKYRPVDSKKFEDSFHRIYGEKDRFLGTVKVATEEKESLGEAPDLIFSGVGWPSKSHEITERQRQALERDPFHTTLSDKRKRLFENQEKQARFLDERRKKITGIVSDV